MAAASTPKGAAPLPQPPAEAGSRAQELVEATAEWRTHAAHFWSDDPTLDPTTPLLEPHFRHGNRLRSLLVAPAADKGVDADMRLVDARKLIRHIDNGGRMLIRQKIEEQKLDLFVDDEKVRVMLPELGDVDKFHCTFPPVCALSYAWITPADPDPNREQLLQLRPVLVWYLSERCNRFAKFGRSKKYNMQTNDFGIFIEYVRWSELGTSLTFPDPC